MAGDARPPPSEGRRARRRGPRSAAAISRRSRRAPSGGARGEPRADPPANISVSNLSISPLGFCILSVNIRSLLKNSAELCVRLRTLEPDVIALTETWLDDSVASFHIPGYFSVSRRDRNDGRQGGGIALYAAERIRYVGHLEDSSDAERSWHMVHADVGPILLGIWYRPPDASDVHTTSLAAELQRLSHGMVGTVVVGDMNIHHARWLRFSNGNTGIGQVLQDICAAEGITQCVHQPTRGDYLLDLVLSDMPDCTATSVLPPITDHRVVLTKVMVDQPTQRVIDRHVWHFRQANWAQLRRAFRLVDWSFIETEGAHQAAERVTSTILRVAKLHIPYRRMRERKATHPWITPRCEAAVKRKCDAEGTPQYQIECQKCSDVIASEYAKLR